MRGYFFLEEAFNLRGYYFILLGEALNRGATITTYYFTYYYHHSGQDINVT